MKSIANTENSSFKMCTVTVRLCFLVALEVEQDLGNERTRIVYSPHFVPCPNVGIYEVNLGIRPRKYFEPPFYCFWPFPLVVFLNSGSSFLLFLFDLIWFDLRKGTDPKFWEIVHSILNRKSRVLWLNQYNSIEERGLEIWPSGCHFPFSSFHRLPPSRAGFHSI